MKTPESNSIWDRAGWNIVWHDEFEGTELDRTNWTFDIGGSGWGNQELQYYTEGTSNVAMDGQGHLVITARKGSGGHNDCWNGACQLAPRRPGLSL